MEELPEVLLPEVGVSVPVEAVFPVVFEVVPAPAAEVSVPVVLPVVPAAAAACAAFFFAASAAACFAFSVAMIWFCCLIVCAY